MRRALLALVLLVACKADKKPGAPAADAAAPPPSFDEGAIARAEDLRRARDVPPEARTSHDVAARRRAARALSRIADAPSAEALLAHLADEDAEVASWAAYGLGQACRGREEAHVRALAARAASLATAAEARPSLGGRGVSELDPWTAIARALGRCGGPLAEQVLVSLAVGRGAWAEPALLGLGDLAARRKQLGAEAMTALLEAAAPREGAPLDLAFYALSRAEPGEAFGGRVLEAARAALARPGPARILAVKTLGRAGRESAREAATELSRVVMDGKSFDPGERAEAARGLGGLGERGHEAAADALARLTPDRDGVAIAGLLGPEFHVLYTLVGAVGGEPPKRAEPALRALSRIDAPAEPRPALARRLTELRCAAALGLARGVSDADVLVKCDAPSGEIGQRARLASLLRRPLTGERRAAFRAFTRSEHLRVREAAVEAVAQHPELGDLAAEILAEALASKKAGLVATAAEVLHMHPERAMVLAASEKRAALDPRAPPPTGDPAQELSPAVGKALGAAVLEKWPEDRVETRIALVEAAASVRHRRARELATAGCNDANVVVRERAQKALRTLGEAVSACDAPDREATAAPELGSPLARPARVAIATETAELSIVLEPELSPVTAARIASLVRSGFYKGLVVHRVVPGFVVQFGDPEGDGYGGSGTSLRCETSPVPFGPLDVGMALAGRDTGSSQLFVTLSRTPHLDGEYTRVGRAEGDWASVAEGDVILDAKLSE